MIRRTAQERAVDPAEYDSCQTEFRDFSGLLYPQIFRCGTFGVSPCMSVVKTRGAGSFRATYRDRPIAPRAMSYELCRHVMDTKPLPLNRLGSVRSSCLNHKFARTEVVYEVSDES